MHSESEFNYESFDLSNAFGPVAMRRGSKLWKRIFSLSMHEAVLTQYFSLYRAFDRPIYILQELEFKISLTSIRPISRLNE